MSPTTLKTRGFLPPARAGFGFHKLLGTLADLSNALVSHKRSCVRKTHSRAWGRQIREVLTLRECESQENCAERL